MTMKKIKSKGTQYFNVPNDEEGQMFLTLLSKYMNNTAYKSKFRGRGSRKHAGNRCDISPNDAEWIAVYINGKKGSNNILYDYIDKYNRVCKENAYLAMVLNTAVQDLQGALLR